VASRQSKKTTVSTDAAPVEAPTPPLQTPPLRQAQGTPSTGSGNTFDRLREHLRQAQGTPSAGSGDDRNKIPVLKTSHFQHLLHFVVSSATPSAGSNAARNACSDGVVLT